MVPKSRSLMIAMNMLCAVTSRWRCGPIPSCRLTKPIANDSKVSNQNVLLRNDLSSLVLYPWIRSCWLTPASGMRSHTLQGGTKDSSTAEGVASWGNRRRSFCRGMPSSFRQEEECHGTRHWRIFSGVDGCRPTFRWPPPNGSPRRSWPPRPTSLRLTLTRYREVAE
ncbi:hypothetical protein F4821DRAFT_241110 [Hypoxylon rubiginosum]|uniref:Uncharacterized protein n=1 Tax=Hypoxylon rubiginosum TaxID=110542 RepID=A0ACC0CXQ8_9PEZI|nr:hypothetical protein F4821DRAFT_241110 [Hypoxylon rubiginosum]